MLKAILKPIIFRREPDKHPGRLAVAYDDDLLLLGMTEILAKIFIFVESDHSFFYFPTFRNKSWVWSFDTTGHLIAGAVELREGAPIAGLGDHDE
jgi:hypothetical protein